MCREGGKDGSLVTFEGTDNISKYVKYNGGQVSY